MATWLAMGAFTLLMLLPGAAVGLVYVTCGIGLVLFPLPTLWVYLTPVVAGASVRAVGLSRWIAVATVVGALAVTATLPSLVSNARWTTSRARWALQDRHTDLPQQPDRVAFVTAFGRVVPDQAVAQLACDDLCQRLLYGDLVREVAVVGWNRSDGEGTVVRYHRERRAACPPAFEGSVAAQPYVARATVLGDCLVPEVETVVSALDGPWLFTQRWSSYELERKHDQGPPVRAVVVFAAGASGAPTLDGPWREHRVEGDIVQMPTALVPRSSSPDNMDFQLWRERSGTAPLSTDDALMRAFGWDAPALPAPPPPDLDLLRQMIDRPGEAPFDKAAHALVREVVTGFGRGTPLDPAVELPLYGRMLADPRFVDLYVVVDRVRLGKQTVAVADSLIARVLMPVDESVGHTRASVARVVAGLPLATLRPHADALFEATRDDGQWPTSTLRAVLPSLLDVPATFTREGLANSRFTTSTLVGLCNAPDAAVVDVLDDVERTGRDRADDSAVLALSVLTLRAHGRPEAAAALDALRTGADRKDLERSYARWGAGGRCVL
ncbi:MAG: hypothetical protein H6733_14330 [Alphaproteobacteria bacterium]|nr:hypothetical protein [Alphaproteobacteria bacterium]